MLMHLQLQATVGTHHAALSPHKLCPLGPAFLASPLYHQFQPDLRNLQLFAHITSSNGPGANEDTDDDVGILADVSGLESTPLRTMHPSMLTITPLRFL